jgi:hypothetical protein
MWPEPWGIAQPLICPGRMICCAVLGYYTGLQLDSVDRLAVYLILYSRSERDHLLHRCTSAPLHLLLAGDMLLLLFNPLYISLADGGSSLSLSRSMDQDWIRMPVPSWLHMDVACTYAGARLHDYLSD